ncbi:MAG: Uma2 family endonuclease [Thermoleophilaceae bacterium]
MAAVHVAQRMTAEEFLARPFEEGLRRQELVDGEIVVGEPTPRHNSVQKDLLFALESWIRGGEGRGQVFIPLDVKLDDLNVFAPDISWYRASNPVDLDSKPPSPLPDLAVEVRSPSTWRYDLGAKMATYERRGLPELWLVDTPAEQVLVFRRSSTDSARFDIALELGGGDSLTSPLLPGFATGLDELFARPGGGEAQRHPAPPG